MTTTTTRHSTKTRRHSRSHPTKKNPLIPSLIVLLTTHLPLTCHAQQTDEDDIISLTIDKWLSTLYLVIPYLVTLFFLSFSLHILLYIPIATQLLMKKYLTTGLVMEGSVLSCTDISNNLFLIDVLYVAREHKFPYSPILQFRHPEAVIRKKFLRRFETQRLLLRGSSVDILLLSSPRSGCTREVIETTMKEFSCCRMVMIVLPGFVLVGLVCYLAVMRILEMDEDCIVSGWVMFGVGAVIIEIVSWEYNKARYAKVVRNRFNSAKPYVISERQVV